MLGPIETSLAARGGTTRRPSVRPYSTNKLWQSSQVFDWTTDPSLCVLFHFLLPSLPQIVSFQIEHQLLCVCREMMMMTGWVEFILKFFFFLFLFSFPRKGTGHHEGLVRVLVENSRPLQTLPTTNTAGFTNNDNNSNNNNSSPADDSSLAHPTLASLLVSSRYTHQL